MANDLYWNSVVLAMHMDDAALTDLKGNTITAVGNAARSSMQSKFGGYSLYLDGAGDYLTAQYNPAKFDWWTEDFTLEAWVYADAFTTWQYSQGTYLHANLIGNTAVAALSSEWSFGPLASGVVQFRYWTGTSIAVTSTQIVTAGAWNHVAMTKTSSGINIFVNGVGLASPVAISGTPTSSTSRPLAIGVMNNTYLAGFVDDLRITKGVARYTADFTPPTATFADRGPQLSGTVMDSSGSFAARLVRAYRRSDGALAGQAVSNATTGAYSITTLDDTVHFAVVHDGAVPEYDPYWNNVTLAMHMDDVGLTDVKGHTVTLVGNASRSAVQSKFGGYSAYLDGSGDYLTTPASAGFDFGKGDFTVECFVYLNAMPTSDAWPSAWSSHMMVVSRGTPGTSIGYGLVLGITKIMWNDNDLTRATGNHGMTTGTWYHLAASRSGSTLRTFVDGQLKGSATVTTDYTLAQPLTVGCETAEGAWFNGYIDDLRITKGVARYTADFTPPTSAFLHGVSVGSPTENALILDNITPL